ncbi:MAG: tetratricopeptide repeat protein [Opitutaceae bacterium]|jgi:hypothetical protein
MSTTPTKASAPSPAGDDRNLVPVDETYVAPNLEDRLAIFWAKNSKTVIAVFVLVVLAVLAKGGYDIYATQREKSIAADYAAATTDAKLKSFIAANVAHPLAGIAELRLADEAYAAGNYKDAQSGYVKAAAILGNTTFGQRARLGEASALIQAGKPADAEAALKPLLADLAVAKGIRAEAAYQLASLAVDAGRTDEATKLIAQIASIDPAGQWTQRAMMLQSRIPAPTAPAVDAKVSAPAINFKATP